MRVIQLQQFLDACGKIAGRPIRKEKRAASSRLRPRNSAAVSVEPERETPGISAPTWAMPTTMKKSSMLASPVVRV